jgi:hypothetical protein
MMAGVMKILMAAVVVVSVSMRWVAFERYYSQGIGWALHAIHRGERLAVEHLGRRWRDQPLL